MKTIKLTLVTPGDRGATITTSIEAFVNENDAEEQGEESARLVNAFLSGFSSSGWESQ